jgi:hypothetical protein
MIQWEYSIISVLAIIELLIVSLSIPARGRSLLMAMEVPEAIVAFGERILAGAPDLSEPVLSLSADGILSLLAIPRTDPSSPAEIGLLNVLYRLLFENWSSLGAVLPSIQAALMTLIREPLVASSISAVADTCIELYKRLQLNWPEFVTAVLDDPPLPITGFLLAGVVFWNDTAFLSSNSEKLLGLYQALLPSASPPARIALLNSLTKLVSNSEFTSHPDLLNAAWEAAFGILAAYPDRAEYFRPFLEELFTGEANPPSVAAAIAAVADLPTATVVLQMLPCLTSESLLAFLPLLRDVAARAIAETNAVPTELLVAIDGAPFDDVSDASVKLIADFVGENLETPAGLALFAVFLSFVGEDFGAERAFGVLEGALASGEPLRVCLALRGFQFVSHYSDGLSFEIADFTPHLPLLAADAAAVRSAAFAALAALIEEGVFASEEQLAALLAQFPRIAPADVPLFCRLLRKLLRAGDVLHGVAELVRDFAAGALPRAAGAVARAHLLSVLCAIGSTDAAVLERTDPAAFVKLAVELIESPETAAYTFASRALSMFTSMGADLTKRGVGLIPRPSGL